MGELYDLCRLRNIQGACLRFCTLRGPEAYDRELVSDITHHFMSASQDELSDMNEYLYDSLSYMSYLFVSTTLMLNIRHRSLQ